MTTVYLAAVDIGPAPGSWLRAKMRRKTARHKILGARKMSKTSTKTARFWLLCLVIALTVLPLCSSFKGGLRGGGDDAVRARPPPHLFFIVSISRGEKTRIMSLHPLRSESPERPWSSFNGLPQAAAEAQKYAQEQVTSCPTLTSIKSDVPLCCAQFSRHRVLSLFLLLHSHSTREGS